MLLNEPTPHPTRPTAAPASTRELPPVEADGAPAPPPASSAARRSDGEADTIVFTAVDMGRVDVSGGGSQGSSDGGGGSNSGSSGGSADGGSGGTGNGSGGDNDGSSGDANGDSGGNRGGAASNGEVSAAAEDGESPRSAAQAPTVGIVTVGGGADSLATVALDVDAVKRALAEGLASPDTTDTVSLSASQVRQAIARERGGMAGVAPAETTQLTREPIAGADAPADDAPAEESTGDASTAELSTPESESPAGASAADSSIDFEPSSSESESLTGASTADSSIGSAASSPESEHPSATAADSRTDFEPSDQHAAGSAPDAEAGPSRPESDSPTSSATADSSIDFAASSPESEHSSAAAADSRTDFEPSDQDAAGSALAAEVEPWRPEGDSPTASAPAAKAEPSSPDSDSPTASDSGTESSAEAEPSIPGSDSPTDSASAGEDSSAEAATDREPSADLVPAADTDPDTTPASHLASTDLSTTVSTLVAVPETADDVIATIHAAATVVAEADRRARKAAVAKADPWTGLDLHRPAEPAPVDDVLDLLSPVLERPLLVVEQPGLPAAADVVALHRSELEVDFVEPPVVAAGAEPPIPPRYGPGLSVLPHIEFPV